ncbi:MAG: DNA repair protein RecN [Candidatus Dadabacteria bacterium]|nr:DNA repair protein RecN [Candidatus Dadabacteria bacterium]NIQ16024.1 DNA repair protein RecN [Candidatus Dadabacteria bacterium]
MLLELKLRNFAIIDDISINFTDGLNIITGETGTGKSIIIDAISIILGDKFRTEIIKTGEEESSVEALFKLQGHLEINKKLEEHGIDDFDDELIIKRSINRNGRGKIYINGGISNLKILSDVTDGLVNIFGQHQHQELLNKHNYIKYIDQYSNVDNEVFQFQSEYKEYIETLNSLEKLIGEKDSNKEKEDYLRFQYQEISQANLKEGEEEILEEEANILSNSERFNSSLNATNSLIYESDDSISGLLRKATDSISEITDLDTNIKDIKEKLESIRIEIEEIYYSLRNYEDKIKSNPQRLEEIIERLEFIKKLKRKYGETIKVILQKQTAIEKELNNITNFDETLENLKHKLKDIEDKVKNTSELLTNLRKKNASELEKLFIKEAESVGLKGAYLKIKIDNKDLSLNGKDDVDFLFTANPDQEPKSIVKVASGGELSRIMLILKGFLSNKEAGSILIFDEADSGIGGVVAETIGKKIKKLTVNNQVICITHLPQVAKFADNHLLVSKNIKDNITEVEIKALKDEERIKEISRMLAGKSVTEKTIEVAEELIKSVN